MCGFGVENVRVLEVFVSDGMSLRRAAMAECVCPRSWRNTPHETARCAELARNSVGISSHCGIKGRQIHERGGNQCTEPRAHISCVFEVDVKLHVSCSFIMMQLVSERTSLNSLSPCVPLILCFRGGGDPCQGTSEL